MNPEQIIDLLTQKQIRISFTNDRLAVEAAKGAITPELAALIRDNKPELIAFLQQTAAEQDDGTCQPPVTKANHNGAMPLSFAQQTLWMIDSMEQGSANYNVFSALEVNGWFDEAIAEQAFKYIIQRHQPLRTLFVSKQKQVCQEVLQTFDFNMECIDLRGSEQQQEALDAAIEAQKSKPFDLATDLKLRAGFVRCNDNTGVLMVTMHHIASDGWSMAILQREFCTIYQAISEGETPQLPELVIQYSDYAQWQRDWLQGEQKDKLTDYWQKRLSGIPEVHQLPLDNFRPVQSSYRGAVLSQPLEQSLASGLINLGQSQGATLYMVLQSAYALLLSRFSGQNDIVMGSAVANRGQQEVAGLIGFFTNTLVQRVNVAGNPKFVDLLDRCKQEVLSDLRHQQLPFELLVEHLNPERQTNHNPLFQVVLNLVVDEQNSIEISDVRFDLLDNELSTSNFDLTLSVKQTGDSLVLNWRYATDIFNDVTINNFNQAFIQLLGSIVADPTAPVGQLSMISTEQRQLLLESGSEVANTESCVHQLFEQQAEQHSQRIALIMDDEQISYAQLDARANQLAHYLCAQGISSGSMVGICTERSIAMVCAILAVLKTGAAYVPMDPGYPDERIRFICQDANIKLIMTQAHLQGLLPLEPEQLLCIDSDALEMPTNTVDSVVKGDDLAYMIYTSGSTGQPKGVLVEHRAAAQKLQTIAKHYQLGDDDAMLLFSSICFDASVTQLFAPLSVGAKVVIKPDEITDGEDFMAYLVTHQVTMMHLVPQYLSLLLEDDLSIYWLQTKLRGVISGGDVLGAELLRCWAAQAFASRIALYNSYGPTEATVTACSLKYDGNEISGLGMALGAPLDDTRFYVVDEQLQLLPDGAIGELLIGGSTLARGYHNQPQLNAELFIDNPFGQDGRVYLSGDLVKRLSNGSLQFIGRRDSQIKVRGFRIEPGEIQQCLLRSEAVSQCAVVAQQDSQGNNELLAYIVLDHTKVDVAELTELLSDELLLQLPYYLIPGRFVVLEQLPLTVSGKVDKKALVVLANQQPQVNRSEPANDIERQLQSMWLTLLGKSSVSVSESFFKLGGHSLLATRLASQIRKTFEVEFTLKLLFESPSIEEQAQMISMLQKQKSAATEQVVEEVLL